MLRILSWSSGLGCDKGSGPDYAMMVTKEQTSPPIARLPVSAPVKRKRSPSFDASAEKVFALPLPHESNLPGAPPTSRAEIMHRDPASMEEFSSCDQPTASPVMTSTSCSAQAPVVSASPDRLDRMRQTISTQLSLEILLKHKELRLIDQEMAKCQVALEQLRRCTEIPFPSTQAPSELVSEGRGPAIRQRGQRFPPDSPAAWGVTDGPYARYYAKWLLEDRRFDGGEPEPELTQPLSAVSSSGRSTRGHYVDVLGGKSVKSRGRGGPSLQALPAGYGQPKEKATGPMILKRKSDGSMVKLVCPDCGRHDFGSAQGFINHCRIGHGRSFASHDAAAEACGEPVEYNDNGSIKGVEPVVSSGVATSTSVHPLVRSAKLLPQTPPIISSYRGPNGRDERKEAAASPMSASFSFQASTQTPHLSALVRNQGLGLDLQNLVTEAKTKVELPDSDTSEDEMDIDSPVPTVGGRHPQVAGSKQPVKSSMSSAPSSLLKTSLRTGTSTSGMKPIPSQHSSDETSRDSFSGVLPSPTNDSTQAPSLVDDDEEFDPQSPMSSGEVDEADVDFEVHDDEQSDRVTPFQDLSTQQPTCTPNPTTTRPATRRGIQGSDKQVTFVSASPAPEGSDRKRRKI